MWKSRNGEGNRKTDYKKEVYLLLSAQMISERLCQFWTDAKCLLSVMQYWKMKQLDMIVVWSDAGECFQLHCASICAWCFNAFLHWWELHWSSRTSVLVVTFCLITPEQRRLLDWNWKNLWLLISHWDNRVSRCRSLYYHYGNKVWLCRIEDALIVQMKTLALQMHSFPNPSLVTILR